MSNYKNQLLQLHIQVEKLLQQWSEFENCTQENVAINDCKSGTNFDRSTLKKIPGLKSIYCFFGNGKDIYYQIIERFENYIFILNPNLIVDVQFASANSSRLPIFLEEAIIELLENIS